MSILPQLRNAVTGDLPVIVDIYNQSIVHGLATADTEAIAVESREEWYNQHDDHRPLWVVESANTVVGWLSFRSFYGRPAYHQTAEISIYIADDHQSRGYGNFLLTEAIARSPNLGLTNLVGFIFAHNQPSLHLFKKSGFMQWGFLPDIAELKGVKRSLVILGKSLS
jgi:phosphinothricin acetyltransferase